MAIRRIIASAVFMSIFFAAASAQSGAYLIEGEAFQFKGKWIEEKSSDCLGSSMLRVYQDNNSNPESDALTVVNITETGNYNIWVRSQDFLNSTRPRTFTLTIGDIRMEECGNHGHAGFYWQKVGNVDLEKKQTLLRLSDTGLYFGRCDAILIIKDKDTDPNRLTNAEIAKWRRNPVSMQYETENLPQLPEPVEITSGYTTAASASNDNIRISFIKMPDGRIVCKNDYFANGAWRRFSGNMEDNRVAIISNKSDLSLNHNQFFPAWDSCSVSRSFTIDDKKYQVNIDGDNSNPFFTGNLTEARAISVSKTEPNTIKVGYDCGSIGSLTGYWTIPASGSHISVKFDFKANNEGMYSVVMHSLKGIEEEAVTGVIMAPMYCGKRIPSTPLMLSSSMMTQCMACIEASTPTGTVSSFASADLNSFSNEWGSYDHSPIGFTLRNCYNEMQPVAISPIPGMKDSKTVKDGIITANFNIGIMQGNLSDAIEYVSDNIFEVSSYRKQDSCSLTKTLENITSLLKDDSFSGWDNSSKGFWDIETNGKTSPTVVQSSPLAIIGAAMIHNDEEMYIKRALPTIEYALSRNGFRTCMTTPQQLNPMESQFPTTLYEGINLLSGYLNPWLEKIAIPSGSVRTPKGYFCNVMPFRQQLSAYHMTGDEKYMENAATLADKYVSEIIKGNSQIFAQGSFYNSQMSPEWTSLIDMYRTTGNMSYIEAATTAATHTIAGVKTWPKVTDGNQTVHIGNKYDGVTTIWWKGTEQYRLGFPRTDGDAPEHDVEAWKVSSVGLGIEQPATYFVRNSGKTVRPVFMNSWAPRLTELSQYSGKQIYNTYARNAIIGRYDNYPGYYATGYTDIISSEQFPYVGPDVSSIYFHHIPAHWAMIQDQLITDIVCKSKGTINFPTARQEGFVWFSNNIYGIATGEILGQDASIWMPQGTIEIDNPAVNHLSARNKDRLYVMLTNDDETESAATVYFRKTLPQNILGTYATLHDTDGNTSIISFDKNEISINIPPHDIVIAEFEATWEDAVIAPVLDDGMRIIDTETAAGNVYLYRIRSPFGWDSIYGFADCGDIKEISISVECNGEKKIVSSWPFEWSFSKFNYDEPLKIKIDIIENSTILNTISDGFISIPTIVHEKESDSKPSLNGIYRIDGVKTDRMDLPGLYIVNGRKVIK